MANRWLKKKHREARLQAKLSQSSTQKKGQKQPPSPARKGAAGAQQKPSVVEAR